MEVNIPEVLEEVVKAFQDYELALTTNDVASLDRLFRDAPETIRYGAGENLYGYDEISSFRKSRPSHGLDRSLHRTVITTYGREFATAMTLFERAGSNSIGRQSQTWCKIGGNWTIVAAHVSTIDPSTG